MHTNGKCHILHFSMQEEGILELHTNIKCNLCTLQYTCKPLCTIGMHLITLLNIHMPRYQYVRLNTKCHKVTLIMKNQGSRIFGFMHDFWIIPFANMTYTRSPNYTNMVVDKHGRQTIQSCGCCVAAFAIVVSCFCPHKCTSLIVLDKWLSKYTEMLVKLVGHQCNLPYASKKG